MSSEISSDAIITMSPTFGVFAAALAKAQGEITTADKGQENTYFKQRYADFAAVWNACHGPLSKNEIAIIQAPQAVRVGEQTEVTVQTLLAHSSGEWMSFTCSVWTEKSDPQAIGTCITYLRRYTLQAAVGVAAEDDDGESAMGRGETASDKAPPARPPAAKQPADGPMCPVHHVPFFKKGKMKSFAHKTEDGGWCNMPEGVQTPAPTPPATTTPPAKKWADFDEPHQKLFEATMFQRIAELKGKPAEFQAALAKFVALGPPSEIGVKVVEAAGLVFTDDETKNLLLQYLMQHC